MEVGDTVVYKGEEYIVNAKLLLHEWLICERCSTREPFVIRMGDAMLKSEYDRLNTPEPPKPDPDPMGAYCDF